MPRRRVSRFIFAGGALGWLGAGISLRAQPRREPPVMLPPVEVTATVPLVKTADYQMHDARWFPAAVVAGDFIYIIGGTGSDGELLNSVERFDTRTGKSEPFAQLRYGRRAHRAVLVGDKIFVLGGVSTRLRAPDTPADEAPSSAPDMSASIFPGAGSDGSPPPDLDVHATIDTMDAAIAQAEQNTMGVSTRDLPANDLDSSVEVIDLATRAVSRAPNMPEARADFACALRAGKIYVIGGARPYKRTLSSSHTNAVQVLDVAANQWSKGVPMPTPRDTVGVLVDGGFIITAGGYDGIKQRAEVEAFNPADGIWRTLPPLAKPVSAESLVFLDHYLFLFGDYAAPGELMTYDLATKRSAAFPLQVKPARHAAAVTLDGKIYLIGGLAAHGTDPVNYIQVYTLRKKD